MVPRVSVTDTWICNEIIECQFVMLMYLSYRAVTLCKKKLVERPFAIDSDSNSI